MNVLEGNFWIDQIFESKSTIACKFSKKYQIDFNNFPRPSNFDVENYITLNLDILRIHCFLCASIQKICTRISPRDIHSSDNFVFHSMTMANLNRIKGTKPTTTRASKIAPWRIIFHKNQNTPFRTSLHKFIKNCLLLQNLYIWWYFY